MNKSHDLQNVVSFHEDTTENKTEGSATTETSEIVKNDQAAEEAVEDIKERLEEQKINEELKDPEKTATEHNSGVVTVTDSNSNKDNKEETEQKVEEPFEAGEDLTSSEAQTEETTEDEDKTSSTTAPVTTTPVDLFLTTVEETTETVEDVQQEHYEMSVITKEEKEDVVENTTTLKEETTTETNTETAEVAAVINNSFVKTEKNKTAIVTVDQGTIITANGGEGVNASVSGNTISVSLQNPETTTVEVDCVDSLGNITTVVVAFE